MINENFVIVGAIVLFIGNFSYLIDTVRGKIKPNRVSWLLWAIAPLIAFAAEINIEEKFYEYNLELSIGTDLKALEKHGRDLAIVLASPTGRVYWQIPVPGKSYVKLKVPKPSKEYFESIRAKDEAWKKQNTLRSKIALLFYLMGKVNYHIAKTILRS